MVAQRRELSVTQPQSFSFVPQSLEEAQKYAALISNSQICPQALRGRPGDVFVILQMGHELGLKPMQAMRTLGCINGVPFAYGDGLLALIKTHKDFVNIKEWTEGDINLNTLTAYCTITRKDQEPQTRSFSVEDAKRAGLWGKDVWLKYPKRMLQHRARTYAGKDVFPDALYGLGSEDEVMNIAPSVEAPKTSSKGMKGFKEAVGLTPNKVEETPEQENVIDVEVTDVTDKTEVSNLDELKELIERFNVTKASVTVNLKKFGVDNLESLTDDMIDKWINHLKSKEQKND